MSPVTRLARLRGRPPAASGVSAEATCDTAGILGPAAHLASSMQVGRALRFLATREAPSEGELVYGDVWEGRFTRMAVPRDPACPCCASRRFDFLSVETPQASVG